MASQFYFCTFRTFPINTADENRRKTGVINSSGVKSVVEKFRVHDGLVWMVGLSVEINLRF